MFLLMLATRMPVVRTAALRLWFYLCLLSLLFLFSIFIYFTIDDWYITLLKNEVVVQINTIESAEIFEILY